MEEIKKIVSEFTGINVSLIKTDTPIHKNIFRNSIKWHQMFASLNNEGLAIHNYSEISTFGDLKKYFPKTDKGLGGNNYFVNEKTSNRNNETNGSGIGIDIEELDAIPETKSHRSHPFYTENFSQREISYCLLKEHPTQSFAGLFALKEAIIKANNQYMGRKFNEMEISHNDKGMPFHEGFILSISHNTESAVGIALSENLQQKPIPVNKKKNTQDINSKLKRARIAIAFLFLIQTITIFYVVFKTLF